MNDQNVTTTITFLLEAVLEFRRRLSASHQHKTYEDYMRLSGYTQLTSPYLFVLLRNLKLTGLASQFKDASSAVMGAAMPEDTGNDHSEWYSAVSRLRMIIDALPVILNTIRADPSVINDVEVLAAGVVTGSRKQFPESGVFVHLDPPSIEGSSTKWKGAATIPLKIFAILNNRQFGHDVAYEVIDNAWDSSPDPKTRIRTLNTIKNIILPEYAPHLELVLIHGKAARLQLRKTNR